MYDMMIYRIDAGLVAAAGRDHVVNDHSSGRGCWLVVSASWGQGGRVERRVRVRIRVG